MQLEEKIKQRVQKIKADKEAQKIAAQKKVEQRWQVIQDRKSLILDWLKQAGVEESQVQFSKAPTHGENFSFCISIMGVEIEGKTDASLYEGSNGWSFGNPNNDWLIIGGSLRRSPEEVEELIISLVAETIAESENAEI